MGRRVSIVLLMLTMRGSYLARLTVRGSYLVRLTVRGSYLARLTVKREVPEGNVGTKERVSSPHPGSITLSSSFTLTEDSPLTSFISDNTNSPPGRGGASECCNVVVL